MNENCPTLTEAEILKTLTQVIDPEIGCNIVDLGLIYSIEIAGSKVTVRMTLTTPGCPMHENIALGAKNALLGIEGVEDAEALRRLAVVLVDLGEAVRVLEMTVVDGMAERELDERIVREHLLDLPAERLIDSVVIVHV